MQRGRHDRRPEEAGGGTDGDPAGQDPDPEVVHRLQGSHHPPGLRDPRRHGSRALLQLKALLVHSGDQDHYSDEIQHYPYFIFTNQQSVDAVGVHCRAVLVGSAQVFLFLLLL